jgi:hypothetical protein
MTMCTLAGLRQVAIALVGDDDRRAGFGDQEIRAGDADIGGRNFSRSTPRASASSACGSVRSRAGSDGCARGGNRLHLILREMHGRGDDVRGVSPRSWMMYSPRSVSTGRMPLASRWR